MKIKPARLFHLWYKITGATHSAALDSTQITIITNGKEKIVPLNELKTLSIQKGWFFKSLLIEADNCQAMVLKGYHSEQLKRFKQQTIDALLTLVASSERWDDFQQSLTQHAHREVYLSSHEWQPIAQLYKLCSKLTQLGIHAEQLTNPLHQQVFKQAQSLTEQAVSELGREVHNQTVVPFLLAKYAAFFDTIEKMPLTDKQRIACVTNDDHNLVIAGAGTGKTATLVGKAGFLVEAKITEAKNILMLAFGNKAAAEMNERIKDRIPVVGDDFKASTFHALGNEVVANFYGHKKALTHFSDQPAKFNQFIGSTLDRLAEEDKQYKALLVNYFSSLGTPAKSELDFENIDEYHEFLSSCRLVTLKGEWVKSVGELRIANYLTLNNVKYEYEANYQYDTRSVARRQYQPDFYLPESDLYIEYLGLNEKFETAPFVDQKSYLEDLAWKRELHQAKGTKMAELYSYQLMSGNLQNKLKEVLTEHSIAVEPIPLSVIFEQLKEENQTEWLGFIELIKRFLGLYKEGGFEVSALLSGITASQCDIERTRAFLTIFEPVFSAYQQELQTTDTLDFSDMIALAVDIIEKGHFFHSYDHILVDEFQDISAGRAKLLKALLGSKPNMRLFAVGDDWQSIYRFNGADIALFTEFNQSFSPATAVPLDKTFRFNNKIHRVSSQFVMANPGQLKKEITTHTQLDSPALRLVDIKNDIDMHSRLSAREKKQQAYAKALQRSLNTFNRAAAKNNKQASVLIIGRFRKENMPMLTQTEINLQGYHHLQVNYVTAHASKGLEADYVIVLGVDAGSFPSSRENDELIDLVLPNKETYLYAEERRLFYVALTRAKHFVYALFDADQGSPFLSEINTYGADLIDSKLAKSFAQWQCPTCHLGTLKALQTRYGKTFYKCTMAPACDTSMNACKHCNAPLQTHPKGFRVCMGCGEIELGCLRCGIGTMVARCEHDPNRETFYGCNRYRRGADDSCGENIRLEEYQRRYNEAKRMVANQKIK